MSFLTSCSRDTDDTGTDTTSSGDTTTNVESETTKTDDSTAYDPAEHNYKNTKWDGKTLKILAIGNSFSVDAMTYLYEIAKAEGVESVILGNLYIGGCTLETHAGNALSNNASYTYYKNTSGQWAKRDNSTMLHGINDEDWDIITMQQASGYSGMASSYTTSLNYLINYVNKNKTNPSAQLVWHMTWAYQQDSTHSHFSRYDNDQIKMYNQICNAVKSSVLPLNVFNIVIPSGTSIQNARTSYFKDTLTRDGYHLSELGRFIAGYTWFSSLTGKELAELKCQPTSLSLTEDDVQVIIESVNHAEQRLFEITESEHTEKPAFDFSNYTQISFDYTVGAYWYSTDATRYAELVKTASNSKYFIATEMFTMETLPVGSVIVVDEGWQYRPERWTSLTRQTTRASPVTQNIFIVTEDWWEGYAYRAFNISVVGSTTDIRNDPSAVTHFRIYLPS